jgi:hypothetical protein
MEVLLATAILLSSVLVLMELASIGRYYVQSVDSQSTAQMLCETALNEILAGAEPLQTVEDRVFEDHPDWVYSVEIEPANRLSLVAVRVTVRQQPVEGPNSAPRGKPKQFSLVRWAPEEEHRADATDSSSEPTGEPPTDPGPEAGPEFGSGPGPDADQPMAESRRRN